MVSTPLKNISQNGNLPQIGGENKKYLKPPPKSVCWFAFISTSKLRNNSCHSGTSLPMLRPLAPSPPPLHMTSQARFNLDDFVSNLFANPGSGVEIWGLKFHEISDMKFINQPFQVPSWHPFKCRKISGNPRETKSGFNRGSITLWPKDPGISYDLP